jgi:pimeloyl-ACP methyl ester carboxylesterase
MPAHLPIIYVRGYAGMQSDVEETVDDPTYGFNAGSTHIRLGEEGKAIQFMFVSPFARLFRDHGYEDVIDGAVQRLPPISGNPERTIWIYRYYDPTSRTFDRPGGRRLSIEEAARGLKAFIDEIRNQIADAKRQQLKAAGKDTSSVQLCKVHLVAHSMGGLICRCLLQKIYAVGEAESYVDKLFTYGTPHGGIHFDIAGGRLLEKLRDMVGFNDSDDFGPQKMYSFLAPNPGDQAPDDFDPRVMPSAVFDTDRVFCIVGTNAEDYAVAAGLSRTAVGPQSDGLVQTDSAYVHGAHRAYIHRSHSGRYGMVNSEEGYQNLQRFLFGNLKVKASLVNFALNFTANLNPSTPDVSYFFETQVSIRGLPVLMHERVLSHYSAEAIDKKTYDDRYNSPHNALPLFTTFLLENTRSDQTMRYMMRIALFQQNYQDGFLVFGEHLERLPLWSDYLIIELRKPANPTSGMLYDAFFCWNSEKLEPDDPLPVESNNPNEPIRFLAPLAGTKFVGSLGANAAVRFEASVWNGT